MWVKGEGFILMDEEDLFLLVEYSQKKGRIILIGARKEEAFLWKKRIWRKKQRIAVISARK